MLAPVRSQAPFVYKYRTFDHPEWLKSILLRDELYFPTARELEDPEEARPKLTTPSRDALISIILEISRRHLTAEQRVQHDRRFIEDFAPEWSADELMRGFEKPLHQRLKEFRVYSLSRRWKNPYLWKKYASRHQGCCLEFRTFGQTYDVRYANEISLDLTDSEQDDPNFLFYKTQPYRREEEVRMIGGFSSPAVMTFDPRALTRIIIGRNIGPKHNAFIRETAAGRKFQLPVVSERDAARFPAG
jgi:hypothetical protein